MQQESVSTNITADFLCHWAADEEENPWAVSIFKIWSSLVFMLVQSLQLRNNRKCLWLAHLCENCQTFSCRIWTLTWKMKHWFSIHQLKQKKKLLLICAVTTLAQMATLKRLREDVTEGMLEIQNHCMFSFQRERGCWAASQTGSGEETQCYLWLYMVYIDFNGGNFSQSVCIVFLITLYKPNVCFYLPVLNQGNFKCSSHWNKFSVLPSSSSPDDMWFCTNTKYY